MLKKILRWIGIGLIGIVGLVAVFLVTVYVISGIQLNKTYSVTPPPLAIPTDAESIERGRHLVQDVAGCTSCHDADLGGAELINDPALAQIYALNLTPSPSGLGAWSDADYLRALAYGVTPEGHSLLVMPSYDFYNFSESDLGAIIAYLKQLPLVDRTFPEPKLGPLGTTLFVLGPFKDIVVAEKVNVTRPRLAVPPIGVTAEYGDYLVRGTGCRGCHGPDLTGAQPPDPGSPPAPGLTQSGELQGWAEGDFINVMRTGRTPLDRQLTEFMPWKFYGRMTDDELSAIWLYLQSLP